MKPQVLWEKTPTCCRSSSATNGSVPRPRRSPAATDVTSTNSRPSNAPRGRSSITPTATAISAGNGMPDWRGGGSANGCPVRRTSMCSGTSTAGSAPRSGCTATRRGSGAPSSPRRCTATGCSTARSTSSTSTATTAGGTASRPTPGAWCRTSRRRISRRSSGNRTPPSTGAAMRSRPRRQAAC